MCRGFRVCVDTLFNIGDAKYKDKSGNNTEENPRKVTIYLVSLLFCFTTYNKDHLIYKQ